MVGQILRAVKVTATTVLQSSFAKFNYSRSL